MAAGKWIWCTRCGSYASTRPVGLRRRCPGNHKSGHHRAVLTRLNEGYQPNGPWGKWVGSPVSLVPRLQEEASAKQYASALGSHASVLTAAERLELVNRRVRMR